MNPLEEIGNYGMLYRDRVGDRSFTTTKKKIKGIIVCLLIVVSFCILALEYNTFMTAHADTRMNRVVKSHLLAERAFAQKYND